MDLDAIYQLSSYHSLTSIVAFSLEKVMHLPHEFDQAKKKAIRKLALFDIEREKVFQSLNSEKIWFLPLKGIILKDYYPQYGMREMADNDLLCDAERMGDIKRIMINSGFACENFGKGIHDIYVKSPVAFEMHNTLFDKKETKHLYEYYKDVKSKLIKVTRNSFEYHFTNEDFYIFLLAHEYKHYILGGTGLKSLIDTYVFLERWNDELNWPYIDEELQKLNIREFEMMNRNLSNAVFSGKQLTETEKESLLYFVTSGSYGTTEGYWQTYMSEKLADDSSKEKRKYIHNRIFVNGEELESKYPFFYKHKILLPTLYLRRLFSAVFIHPKRVLQEIKELKIYSNDRKRSIHNNRN